MVWRVVRTVILRLWLVLCGKLHDVLRFILYRMHPVPVDMEIDWNKCIICQEETTEPLKCPLLGPGTCDSKIEAYRSFLRNVEQFKAMDSLPTAILFGENESAESFQHIMLLGTSLAI